MTSKQPGTAGIRIIFLKPMVASLWICLPACAAFSSGGIPVLAGGKLRAGLTLAAGPVGIARLMVEGLQTSIQKIPGAVLSIVKDWRR